jgi:hypothetical protein
MTIDAPIMNLTWYKNTYHPVEDRLVLVYTSYDDDKAKYVVAKFNGEMFISVDHPCNKIPMADVLYWAYLFSIRR